ncbi:AfsA-related hotdog domain-containing protein [Glycomyces sp. NRRL B-16210]|uniref:AfsA-related hotdog domain-containing protein n=1 Tax=Glycomyces sp. NRRL B-16210 TaxID=1463821 RepID=UPI0004C17458|nr:AfsA-related hotdog domain-containing protein [Glycomyces sp. NRRL B-16210]
MRPTPLRIVGRPFARFAAHTGALTVDQALDALRSGALDPTGAVALVPALGVTETEWAEVETAALAAANLTAAPYPHREPVAAGLHKRDPRNVLIADLRESATFHWRAELVLHPDAAPFADRDNGTGHLPGMVEVEAGVQMAMGVTERYLLPSPGEFVFTTSGLDLAFAAFLFPLPAHVELRADRVGHPAPEILELEATVTIHQSGNEIATMRFRSRAYGRALFDRLERDRARAAARTTETTTLEHR